MVATAGHVDHGKSTLVHALTGTDPDRLEEEHRRGLSIRLGYCWTSLPEVGDLAFVDVPGHERFLSTMLSGVGPVPAVLFVVAADDPWMPQAAEHLAALDALGVGHGVLAVTRADLADPTAALARAREELDRTTLRGAPAVVVSGRSGAGLDALRAALAEMVTGLERPPADAAVRLWVDRSFTVQGAGTVVTGTLPAGTIRVGDELSCDGDLVRVRGIESLGRPRDRVTGPARVALALGGRVPTALGHDSVLVAPGAWLPTTAADVRLDHPGTLPAGPMLHVGAVGTGVHVRPFDDVLLRLTFPHPLPLRVGDRALLRDPGSRRVWGLTVLDPAPPTLSRRGAGTLRAKELAAADGSPGEEVRRRGLVPHTFLARLGVNVRGTEPGVLRLGEWLVSDERAAEVRRAMVDLVRGSARELEPGVPTGAVARGLDVPPEIVAALVAPPLREREGRLYDEAGPGLPGQLLDSLEALRADLAAAPFRAPDADRLRALGLDNAALAALDREGLLVRVAETVVLLPDAPDRAAAVLRALPQPFTASAARQAWGTSRRVALPLLAHLDRTGATLRLPDDRRRTRDQPG